MSKVPIPLVAEAVPDYQVEFGQHKLKPSRNKFDWPDMQLSSTAPGGPHLFKDGLNLNVVQYINAPPGTNVSCGVYLVHTFPTNARITIRVEFERPMASLQVSGSSSGPLTTFGFREGLWAVALNMKNGADPEDDPAKPRLSALCQFRNTGVRLNERDNAGKIQGLSDLDTSPYPDYQLPGQPAVQFTIDSSLDRSAAATQPASTASSKLTIDSKSQQPMPAGTFDSHTFPPAQPPAIDAVGVDLVIGKGYYGYASVRLLMFSLWVS